MQTFTRGHSESDLTRTESRANREDPHGTRARAIRHARSLERAACARQVVAPRPCRSPQRAARAPQESPKIIQFFCTSTTPAERARQDSQKPSVYNCTSTTPILAEGRARPARIAAVFPHRPHRSPQRVARAEIANTLSLCASTTPIPERVSFSRVRSVPPHRLNILI